MPVEELEQRVKLLLALQISRPTCWHFSDKIQIGDGSIETLIRFMGKLKQYNRAVELLAVAEDTYTAGPLKVNLVAVANGE